MIDSIYKGKFGKEVEALPETTLTAISNLQAETVNFEGKAVNVLGYYAKGDGGGGLFYWDAASTEADNGGTIIQATAITTGRWKRVFSGAVNVKWFGAKGNAGLSGYAPYSTSDEVFIQKAIDFIATSNPNGGEVYIPSGYYRVKSQIVISTPSITITGDGMESTRVTNRDTDTVIKVESSAPNTTLNRLAFSSHLESVNGTVRTISVNALFFKAKEIYAYIWKCKRGVYSDVAIYLENSYYASITNCKINTFGLIHPDPHIFTGLECYQYSGTAIYSQNSNALYITDTDVHTFGVCMHLNDDDGVCVKGGAFEGYNIGVKFTGNSYLNQIIGVRMETHPESVSQLLPYGEQCNVYFNESTRRNTIVGMLGHSYALYHPYNLNILDNSVKGANTYMLPQGKALPPTVPVTGNGLFSRWNNGLPDEWNTKSAVGIEVEREVVDLPKDIRIKNAVKLTATGNGTYIKSDTYLFNPNKGMDHFSFRFWAKMISTSGYYNIDVYNEDTNTRIGTLGMYDNPNILAENNMPSQEWTEYTKIGYINTLENNITTPTNISFRIISFIRNVNPLVGLVAGVTILHGLTYDIPAITEKEDFTTPPIQNTDSPYATEAEMHLDQANQLEGYGYLVDGVGAFTYLGTVAGTAADYKGFMPTKDITLRSDNTASTIYFQDSLTHDLLYSFIRYNASSNYLEFGSNDGQGDVVSAQIDRGKTDWEFKNKIKINKPGRGVQMKDPDNAGYQIRTNDGGVRAMDS